MAEMVRNGIFLAEMFLKRMRMRGALSAVIMFLLCRFRVMLGLTPFAQAYFAACLVREQNPVWALAGMAAGSIGAQAGFGALSAPIGCVVCLAGFLLAYGAEWVKSVLRRGTNFSREGLCCTLAGFATLLPGILEAGGMIWPSIQALAAAFAATICAGFWVHADFSRPPRRQDKNGMISWALLVFACMCGWAQFFSHGAVCAALWLSAACAPLGAGPCMCLAAITGMSLLLGGLGLDIVGLMCVCAFAMGIFGLRARLERALALLVCALVLSLNMAADVYLAVAAVFAAALAFICAPAMPRWARELAGNTIFVETDRMPDSDIRLRALSQAFGDLAEGYEDVPSLPDEQALLGRVRESLCSDCASFSECWGGMGGGAKMLCGLIAEAAQDDQPIFPDGEIPPQIMRACRRGRMIPGKIGGLLDDFYRCRDQNMRKMHTHPLLARQLRQAQKLLMETAMQDRPDTARAPLRVYAGAGDIPADMDMPSGDNYLLRMLSGGRMLLLICDGMGTGENADRESARAVKILWKLMEADVDIALAIDTANTYLMENSDEEIFATVDMCLIDLMRGEALFTKLAASRSLLWRNGRVHQVEGGKLPMGILENISPFARRVSIRPNDVIVMGSDGVMEACASGGFPDDILEENAMRSPTQLADKILREARLRQKNPDDMTVLCARICRAKAS